jgi:hypothetical protein
MIGTAIRPSDDSKPRRAIPEALGYSPKQICAACLLSGLVAAAITAFTSESAAENEPTPAFSVNRLNKADRLRSEPPARRTSSDSGLMPKLKAPEQIPDGCELAFSPIVSQAHANILRACIT